MKVLKIVQKRRKLAEKRVIKTQINSEHILILINVQFQDLEEQNLQRMMGY